MKYIRFLKELTKKDITLAGGKGANLGELASAGMKVPEGFVLTVEAYRRCVNYDSSSEIIRQIESLSIPDDVRLEILEAYKTLGNPNVAVRSSATAEDLPNASFAGQQETYLNIKGENEILRAIKKCWTSLWAPRAMQYRAMKGFKDDEVALAVIIQEMAPHEVSGVVFTVNPLSNNKGELIVNAAPGMGEALVQGEIVPDQWVARRPDGAVLKFTPAPTKKQSPFPFRASSRVRGSLNSQQIRELADLCLKVEEHFDGLPQDIEWSYGQGQFYLLQSRPITTL